MTIDILCKVVDNFGDIGVAWRLARALSELPDPPRVRLVVDDLEAFASIHPSIDPDAGYQFADGIEIVPWRGDPSAAALESYRARPAASIIECFACGRPDWLEDMLFAAGAPPGMILDLEHLTAEPYASELHLASSLTRSASVRKALFIPGFDEGSGGLAMDRSFARALERAASEAGRADLRREILSALAAAAGPVGAAAGPVGAVDGPVGVAPAPGKARGPDAPPDAADRFWVPVFSYERDYGRIVADLADFAAGGDPIGAAPALTTADGAAAHGAAPAAPRRPLLALAAAGRSQACFIAAWEAAARPFPVISLPFLPQETWDQVLAASDFSIVRGEDSWARAALAGRPFLWQAYPQAERYQMVKVEAFLERLGRHFRPADLAPISRLYRAFNDRDADGPGVAGDESLGPVLEAYEAAWAGFRAFGASLTKLTGLAADLLTFFRETV